MRENKKRKREDIKQQGFINTGIDCCTSPCAAGGASVSPPAHGANDKHKTTYPSFKRGGIGGARSLPPPVADFTSSVRLAPATCLALLRSASSLSSNYVYHLLDSVIRHAFDSLYPPPAALISAPRGEGSGSVLRVGISKQSRPAQESSAPEAARRPRQRARHTRLL